MNADIQSVIGLEGDNERGWFRVLWEIKRGQSVYWPSYDDNGQPLRWPQHSWSAVLKHRVERSRYTIWLRIMGSAPLAALEIERRLGCRTVGHMGETTVEVYPMEDHFGAPIEWDGEEVATESPESNEYGSVVSGDITYTLTSATHLDGDGCYRANATDSKGGIFLIVWRSTSDLRARNLFNVFSEGEY